MEDFSENLDGYYDIKDQLPHYLRERAKEYFKREHSHKESIRTIDAHERYSESVREAFIDAIGGLPCDRTPLNPQCRGTLERDGYTIEKIIFESLPGFHVTGNCYCPEGDGSFPAILFLCGHQITGKASPLYQQACIDLAQNGFIVFTIDPIGQGERIQSYYPEMDEIRRQNTREHTYLNQQCMVAGANLARYFVWDMIRALDYLEARDDVDASRLGATGNSGGGTQTSYLMLVDDRLDAAAPCCSITSREEYMKTGQAQDGEQIIHGAIQHGPNYDDFLSAFAPNPVLIGSVQSDFFCIEGVENTLDRVNDIYDLYGCSENVNLAVVNDTHGLSPPLRKEMVNWFCDQLRDVKPDFETDDPLVEDEALLRCTETGQVVETYPDERRVVDLNRAYIHDQFDDAVSAPTIDNCEAYAEEIRELVIKRLDLDKQRHEMYPRCIDESIDDLTGVRWEKVFFYSEPDIIVAGIVAKACEEPETIVPTVVLPDWGTDEFEDYKEKVAAISRERGLAMAFDPRGLGALRARDVNTPMRNGGEYFDYHGTEYKLASDAIMLGTSLFSMRVYDVLRAREYLARRADNAATFGLNGIGIGGVHALYAAIAEPEFQRIHVADLPPTFYRIATNEEFNIDFRLNVYGFVGECDIPQVLPALEDRDLKLQSDNFDHL